MAKILINSVTDALIVVDMQKDFIDGSLVVPGAVSIIPKVNDYIKSFESVGCAVFFTRDWHPEDHISFKNNGGLWPKHCVAGSEGAMIHSDIYIPPDNRFFVNKGFESSFDAYSGFQGTILKELLDERGIKRLFICGVATEYCVKNTVIGGLNLGYFVFLLLDAIKGVDVSVGDSERAVKEMLERGVVCVTFEDCIFGARV